MIEEDASERAGGMGRSSLWAWLEWLLLAAALSILFAAETFSLYVVTAFVWLALSFGLRAYRRAQVLPRTGLEVPWFLFLLSAAAAVWVSYDRPAALLQFTRLLSAAVLFYAVAGGGDGVRQSVAKVFVWAAAALGLYWLIEGFSPITLPYLEAAFVDKNVRAGTLALALPFSMVFLWEAWRGRKQGQLGWAAISSAILLTSLWLTRSHGAFIGLAAAASLLPLAHLQRRLSGDNQRQAAWFWAAVVGMGIAVVLLLASNGLPQRLAAALPEVAEELNSRSQVWGQSVFLVRDYFFSGSGLASFPLAFSSYRLLIHVPFLPHSHNTFLEVWIEQGLLGAIAILWFGLAILGWGWAANEKRRSNPLGWAALLALVVVAVHGVFDVVFYVQRTAPLLGLVGAYAWGLSGEESQVRIKPGQIGLAALAILAAGMLFYRPLRAMWHANLGALRQTQVELSVYDPEQFEQFSLDEIRQQAPLSAAEFELLQALRWDPGNQTALQRLSMIAFSRHQYAQAAEYAQATWETDSGERVSRLLYGDVLAAAGEVEQAAEVVGELPFGPDRLAWQAWYRYGRQGDQQRAVFAWESVLALDPNYPGAAQSLEEARAKNK